MFSSLQQSPSTQRASNVNSFRSPLLLNSIVNEIRRSGATVWLLQKLDYGFVIRAEFGPKQFRVIAPPLTPSEATIPHEPNSQVHLVSDLSVLHNWLQSLRPSPIA